MEGIRFNVICRIIILEEQVYTMKEIDSADQLINNIISYSSKNGDLLNKYNLSFFLDFFDRNTIMELRTNIETHQQLTEEQFIRFFLHKIQHTEFQTLYLAISLKKLFEAVLERTSNTNYVQFSDFTNYLCQKISNQDLDVVIPAKKIAKESLASDGHAIRQIDIQAPTVFTKVAIEIPKINKDFKRKNKKLEGKANIATFFYSQQNNQVITSGVLSSSILIYNEQLKNPQSISPKICKQLQKDIGIISIAYSAANNRIGVILTNSTMIFWEGIDNYTTQKVIINKNYGDKIFFMDLTNEWITVDRSSINFWDLKEEKVINTIKCKDSIFISDLCSINHLRGICASVTTSKEQKLLLIYRQNKLMAKIHLGNAGCHTLHYNKLTQSLIPLGYTNSLPVYTIQGAEYDLELKSVLRGHRSIITCVDSNDHNTLMITGDDIGQIKIWQLTYMRCIQSVKISKWLNSIKLVKNKLYYSDTRINFMKLQHFQVPPAEKPTILYQFYDKKQQFLWLFTKKDARKIDIKKGKMLRIIVLCNDEQQISSALALGDGFAIGNSKGQLFHYDSDCILKWKKQAHEGQITSLLYDNENRLIFSLGVDNKILIWPQRTSQIQQHRKSIVYKDRQINIMSISNKNTILLLGNIQQKQLYIWDYQILKFHKILKFNEQFTLFQISTKINLILVITLTQIYFIRYIKKQNILQLQIIHTLIITNYFPQRSLITSLQLIIKDEQQKYYMMIGTNKGQMLNLNINNIIQKYYRDFNNKKIGRLGNNKKQSVNILRNQKQQFYLEQNRQFCNVQELKNYQDQVQIKVLWNLKVFKQNVNSIRQTSIHNNQIVCLSQDYIKIISIQSGSIQASLNVDQPLPIKWNVEIDNHHILKQQVYHILKIIDHILKKYGYQMLIKEYQMINITGFMEYIKNQVPQEQIKHRNVQLITSIYKPEDFLGSDKIEPSLKSLEAYKRVKNIKKNSQSSLNVSSSYKKSNIEAQIQRDNIREILLRRDNTKNYESIDKDSLVYDLNCKLQQFLPTIQNKKVKHLKYSQTQMLRSIIKHKTIKYPKLKQNAYDLSQSVIMKRKTDKFNEDLQNSSLKSMLINLNQKLSLHKQKNTKIKLI